MKHAFESEETFTAYATIDAGYYMIGQIKKEFDMPKSPIISAIDKATGFDKKFTNDKAKELIVILEDIIEAKKIIEADFSSDEKLLSAVKNMQVVV